VIDRIAAVVAAVEVIENLELPVEIQLLVHQLQKFVKVAAAHKAPVVVLIDSSEGSACAFSKLFRTNLRLKSIKR
jgi:hypothetical protein